MIQVEPPTFEEALKKQVWKDAMAEEYESIMKNDAQDVVLRTKGKFLVTSKWYSISNMDCYEVSSQKYRKNRSTT